MYEFFGRKYLVICAWTDTLSKGYSVSSEL